MPNPPYSTRYNDGRPCYTGDPYPPSVTPDTGGKAGEAIIKVSLIIIVALLVLLFLCYLARGIA